MVFEILVFFLWKTL